MFGLFKKKNKPCSKCENQSPDRPTVIAGRGNFLCEDHLVTEYKKAFFAHNGRKVIIPPSFPGKYTSYQFETLELLKSYGLSTDDITPLSALFAKMAPGECYEIKTEYKPRDHFDLRLIESARFSPISLNDGFKRVEDPLRDYVTANGVALPPDSNEDICLYPLES